MSKTPKSLDKPEAKVSEPEVGPTPEPEVKKAPVKKAKAVKAVFVPVGYVKVHLTTPSGNEYNLVPREVFTIAAEDVSWFFVDWDWCFRQRLVLEVDYEPTCGYSDPKAGDKNYQSRKNYRPRLAYDDPSAHVAPVEASVEAKVEAPAGAKADSGEKE